MTLTPNPNPTTAPEDPADGTPASRSRRALLAALASGATTALAGCANQTTTTTAGLTSSPGSDDGTASRSPTATATATPTSGQKPLSGLTAWAYPREFRNPEVAYRLRRFDLETMRAKSSVVRDALMDIGQKLLQDIVYIGGMASPEETSTLYAIDGNVVLKGPWSKQAMVEELSSVGNAKPAGTRGNYKLYRDSLSDAALAVSDGLFLVAHRGNGENVQVDSALAVAKRMVAAKRGTKPRYGEVSKDFRTVMAQTVQRGYYSSGYFHDPYSRDLFESGNMKGATAMGQTLRVGNGQIQTALPYLFESAAPASITKVGKLANTYWSGLLTNTSVTKLTPRLFKLAGTLTP